MPFNTGLVVSFSIILGAIIAHFTKKELHGKNNLLQIAFIIFAIASSLFAIKNNFSPYAILGFILAIAGKVVKYRYNMFSIFAGALSAMYSEKIFSFLLIIALYFKGNLLEIKKAMKQTIIFIASYTLLYLYIAPENSLISFLAGCLIGSALADFSIGFKSVGNNNKTND